MQPKAVIGKTTGGKGLFSAQAIQEDEVICAEMPLFAVTETIKEADLQKLFE